MTAKKEAGDSFNESPASDWSRSNAFSDRSVNDPKLLLTFLDQFAHLFQLFHALRCEVLGRIAGEMLHGNAHHTDRDLGRFHVPIGHHFVYLDDPLLEAFCRFEVPRIEQIKKLLEKTWAHI